MTDKQGAAGYPRVIMAGVPAMTMAEIRLGMRDKDSGRHWSRGQCWRGDGHQGDGGGLLMVSPPWDAARREETAR